MDFSMLAMMGLSSAAAAITDMVNGEISGRRQKELLELQQSFASQEAQKGRDFTQNILNQQMNYQRQERNIANAMENTAISRQAADMQRVGINPLMAANFSGFGNASPMSAPSGASSGIASSPSALPMASFRNDALTNFIMGLPDLYLKGEASKRDEGRLDNETRETDANIEFTNAKTVSEKIEALNKEKDLELKDIQKDVLKENINLLSSQVQKNKKELAHIDAQTAKTWGEVDLNEAFRKLKQTEQLLVIEEISQMNFKTKRLEQMLPHELKKLEQDIRNLKTDNRVKNAAEVRNWLDLLSDRVLRLYENKNKGQLGSVIKLLK